MAPINKEINSEEFNPFEKHEEYEGVKGYETGGGDKRSPMASGGETDNGSTSQNIRKEAQHPGGEENAAGKGADNSDTHTSLGSTPIANEDINTGD